MNSAFIYFNLHPWLENSELSQHKLISGMCSVISLLRVSHSHEPIAREYSSPRLLIQRTLMCLQQVVGHVHFPYLTGARIIHDCGQISRQLRPLRSPKRGQKILTVDRRSWIMARGFARTFCLNLTIIKRTHTSEQGCCNIRDLVQSSSTTAHNCYLDVPRDEKHLGPPITFASR